MENLLLLGVPILKHITVFKISDSLNEAEVKMPKSCNFSLVITKLIFKHLQSVNIRTNRTCTVFVLGVKLHHYVFHQSINGDFSFTLSGYKTLSKRVNS